MALTKINSEYEKNVLKHLGWKYQGLKWCEFGNQRSFLGKSGKELLEDHGVEHTSLDLNGLDGALRIDLGKPVPTDFVNRYNVITNYGTIEHINNQYEAFKNAHDMCRAGGIMIHSFPLVGNWPKHCRYYYDLEFVHKLAVACDYEIVMFFVHNKGQYRGMSNVIAVTYIKKETSRFISRELFSKLDSLVDSGQLKNMGDYGKGK